MIQKFFNFHHPYIKKSIKVIWILAISFAALFPAYIYFVKIDLFGLFGGMPSLAILENPENDLSSELISSDGKSMGRYYRYNRSLIEYDDLSDELVNTLVASEDIRYYSHSGLDLIAFLRVLKGVLTFNLAGGGSTITQQLAKNLYTQNDDLGLDGLIAKLGKLPQRIIQKTKEWIISVHLEKNFTKEEIIAMYLNTASFSSNAYGIKVAAETYFDKTVDSLNYQESAVLVGMLQAITRFNPTLHMDASFEKRNQVINKLAKYDYITSEMADSLKVQPIDLSKYKVESHSSGSATYFRSVLRGDLLNWCKENGFDLFEDGLKVFVTIDSRMQEYAEEAVKVQMTSLQKDFFKVWKGREPWRDDKRKVIPNFIETRIKNTDTYRSLVKKYGKDSDSLEIMLNLPKPMKVFSWKGEIDTVLSSMDSLKYYKHFLHAGFMAMDPNTGQVKAWVGGINSRYFQFDHVKQGKRQPGSTFKPFVYGLAMLENYSPCKVMIDTAPTFEVNGKIWRPENATGGYGNGEEMTLRQALARSVNSITAELIKSLNPENVVNFAHQVGIESELDPVPSLCLGTSDVSVYELVGAYSTFVNEGMHIKPYYISKIEDKYGNIVYNSIPEIKESINSEAAYKIVYLLQGGVDEEGGSSQGLSRAVREGNEIGGKTGTTNNASDGWYMAITQNIVSGAWIGGDERTIHFERWTDGQGSRTARPIVDKFLQKVYADTTLNIKKVPFRRPANGIQAILDCEDFKVTQENDSLNTTEPQWVPDNFN